METWLSSLSEAVVAAEEEAKRLVAADEYSYSELLFLLDDLKSEIIYLQEMEK